jgi:hypothetical protein
VGGAGKTRRHFEPSTEMRSCFSDHSQEVCLCILNAMRAGKCPFGISHLTVGADCYVDVPQDVTEQFFRQTAPFVVLPVSAIRRK